MPIERQDDETDLMLQNSFPKATCLGNDKSLFVKLHVLSNSTSLSILVHLQPLPEIHPFYLNGSRFRIFSCSETTCASYPALLSRCDMIQPRMP